MHRRWVLSFTLVVCFGASMAARAQPLRDDKEQLVRDPLGDAPAGEDWGRSVAWRWSSFEAGNYVLLGSAAAAAVTFEVVAPLPRHRQGGVWADEGVRNELRASSLEGQLFASDLSDVLLTLGTAQPYFDAIIIAGWYRQSPRVSEQLTLIAAETMAVNAAILGVVKFAAARERPYGRGCGSTLPEVSDDCDANDRFRSFMSGHSSQTFASAALTCTQHAHLDLYGGHVSWALPCALGFVVASATGALRIVADRHYLTDVLAGAASGTTVGFALPWLLHYRYASSEQADLALLPAPGGVQVVGAF